MGSTHNALLCVRRAVPLGTRRGTRAQCAAGSAGGARSVAVWTEGRQDPALSGFLRPVPLLCSQGHCQLGTGGPRRQIDFWEAQCTPLFPLLPAPGGVCEPPPGMAAVFAVAGSCGEGPVLSRVGLRGAVSLETVKPPVCGHQSEAVGIGQGVGQGPGAWEDRAAREAPGLGCTPPLASIATHSNSAKSQQQSESGAPGPQPALPHPFGTEAPGPPAGTAGVKFGEQLCAGSPWTQARAVNLPVSRTLGRGSSFGQGGRGRAAAPRSPLHLALLPESAHFP